MVDKRAASHSLGLRILAATSVAIGLQRGCFMRHHLALVVCLAVIGSSAHAAPSRHGGRHAKTKKHADVDSDSERIAFRSENIDDDTVDEEDTVEDDDVGEDDIDDNDDTEPAPVRIREQARAKKHGDEGQCTSCTSCLRASSSRVTEMRVSAPVALVACASSSRIDSSSTTLTAVQRGR